MRTGISTAAHMFVAAVIAVAVSVFSLVSIRQVHWPAGRPSDGLEPDDSLDQNVDRLIGVEHDAEPAATGLRHVWYNTMDLGCMPAKVIRAVDILRGTQPPATARPTT
jgi:hypothetical protein